MKNSLTLRVAPVLLSVLLLSGLISQSVQADTTALAYDPAGNITSRTSPLGTTTYTYDALNRLGSEAGPAGIQSYAYDANGNRLSDGAGSYTYSPSSNRMATRHGAGVTLDAAGNITADGLGHTFVYNQTGRLAQVLNGTTLLASYYYNYKGERTRKVTTAAAPQGAQTVIYHYDEASHLIGESTGTGAALRTYIWRDDTPLAQIDYVPSRRVIYFDVDHLNTPRAARDQSGAVVWRWEGDAFGSTPPNENPGGTGVVTVNLRFPGQYFDKESGLDYNGQRSYDPATGRYIQSDPIGLEGGINTYAYIGGSPLADIDPSGLAGVRNGPSRGRGGVPSSAQEISDVVNSANVNRTVEQIRTYDPNFRYSTIAPIGYRYNRQDVEYLNNLLEQYKESSQCTANGLPRPPINYGSTPNGVPFTRHYGAETGPVRNLPVSLIDQVISNGNATPGRNNSTVYYDPVNNTTVVVGSGGVMSVHKQ